jgi:transcriptional regulator with XRE-family HTH domain
VTQSVFTRRYDVFRQMLIAARNDHGLTQTELAEKLRKPQSFVSKYERGERRLDVVEFLEIARCIGFDPYRFLKSLERVDER